MKMALLMFTIASLAWAQPSTVDPRPVLLAFGDSLTAGYGVPRGSGYPEQLQKRLDASGYSYRVVNMGIPGDTSRAGRARIDRALLLRPAMVILELGGNDRASGLQPTQTEAHLEYMIRMFRSTGAIVVLAQSRSPLSDLYTGLARKYNLTLIPEFLDGVQGSPALTIADGRHPNEDGYKIVVDTVIRTIEPLLKDHFSQYPR